MAMAGWGEGCSSSSSKESLLQELPDDVLALISGAMQHRDLCNLSSTCRKLRSLCTSDKLWLPHCERLVPREVVDLHAWRGAMPSFKALCRFLYSVKPLVGIWVHQNPELGNMVYVTWGFVSVVGCRIIPQELGPKGLDTGLLWAPVFEIIGNSDGSLAFFLHGRDRDRDFCYPGRFKPSREDPNVLLLEAEPLMRGAGAATSTTTAAKPCSPTSPDSPLVVPALADHSDDSGDGDDYSNNSSSSNAAFRNGNGRGAASSISSSSSSRKVGNSSSGRSTRCGCTRCCALAAGDADDAAEAVPFNRLAFGDRRRLLEHLAPHVGLSVPDSARGPLFLSRRLEFSSSSDLDAQAYKRARQKDLLLLAERRLLLMWMYSHGDPCAMEPESGSQCEGVDSESLLRALCGPGERDNMPSSSSSSSSCAKASSSSSIKGKGGGGGGGGLCSGSTAVGTSTCPAAVASPAGTGTGAAFSSSSSHGGSSSKGKLGFAKFVRSKMKQIIGKNYSYAGGQEDAAGRGGTGNSGMSSSSSSNAEKKRLQLQEFLRQGTSVGLRLHATSWKLSFYRAWPIMHDNRFALYKMPEQKAEAGREHAGLWGGTFGWPPGRPADDKPGKALFFLLLSYDETDEGRLLIATKILEGTHYVLHPNGSALFTAKMEEPSAEAFPWERLRDGHWGDTVESYQGEGIANGYGFRYPGSKPGDLFVDARGTLAFVWRESKAVLTLQRLDLQALLEQGERVAALPAVANFAYLTKSYSNVFAGYCGPTSLGTITLRSRADGHVRRS